MSERSGEGAATDSKLDVHPRPPGPVGVSATIAIWALAALLLWVPYVMIGSALDELFGYGWPGPWSNEMSQLNGQEELLGLQIGIVAAVPVLLIAATAVAVNAHMTKTRPVLSVLAGLVVIVGGGVALFPAMTTPGLSS